MDWASISNPPRSTPIHRAPDVNQAIHWGAPPPMVPPRNVTITPSNFPNIPTNIPPASRGAPRHHLPTEQRYDGYKPGPPIARRY